MARQALSKADPKHLRVWPLAIPGRCLQVGFDRHQQRLVTIIERFCPQRFARRAAQEGAPSGLETMDVRKQGRAGSCATWPGVWSMRNRASRAASVPRRAGRDPHHHPPRPPPPRRAEASPSWPPAVPTCIESTLRSASRCYPGHACNGSNLRCLSERRRWRSDGLSHAGLLEAQKTFRTPQLALSVSCTGYVTQTLSRSDLTKARHRPISWPS